MTGFALSRGERFGNIGVVIISAIGILITLYLLWRSERKKAAVGRREMQIFLLGYIIILICQIFTQGEFPISRDVKLAFTGVHLAAIIGTTWVLCLNAVVGYQLIDDGTPKSIGITVITGLILAIGTGFIALDTGFSWTGHFDSSLEDPNRNIGLYILYLLAPLLYLVLFFALEANLVLRVLGERKPMLYLGAAALLFAIGQIFQWVISTHICNGTNGKIDGSLFEALFTLLSVGAVWYFWSSITEDDWPAQTGYP